MSSPSTANPPARELTPREFGAFLYRRRGLVLATTLLGVFVAGVVTLFQSTEFVSEGRVHVVEQAPVGGLGVQVTAFPFPGLGGASSRAPAEIEMIVSRPIAGAVVDPRGAATFAPDVGVGLVDELLDLEEVRVWRILRAKLLGPRGGPGTLTAEILRWDYPVEAHAALIVSVLSPGEIEVSLDGLLGRGAPERFPLRAGEPVKYGRAEFVLALDGDLTDRSFLLRRHDRREKVDDFLEKLEVEERPPGSGVLSIRFSDLLADRSAEIVNGVISAYIAHNKLRRLDAAAQNVGFLESELERVRQEKREAEDRLEEFVSRSGDIALPDMARVLIEELVRVDVQRAGIDLKVRTGQALLDRIAAGELSEAEIAGLEIVVFEGSLPNEPIAMLLGMRAALRAEYTPEWPQLKAIEGQITDRLEGLTASIRARVDADRAFSMDLADVIARYEDKLGDLPAAQVELLRNEHAVQTFGTIYALLVGEVERARIAVATTVPSIEVVDWALPPLLRSRPGVKLNIGVGALVGILCGMGFALLRELGRPVTSVAQVEEACGARVLHALPWTRGPGGPLVVRDRPDSREAESFRALGAAFEARVGAGIVVLSSAVRGEGTSRTAGNLACALAEAGRRVLLVDFDRRGGPVGAWFGAGAGRTLATVVAADGKPEDAVVPTGVDGLSLVRVGDAEGRGLTTRWYRLVEQASAAYDVVLVDSPPVLEYADAALAAAALGRALLVLRADRLPEHLAERAAERLRGAGAELVGVVLNGTRREGRSVV